MSIFKSTVLSLLVLCSFTLSGCSKDTPQAEQIPLVMVAQPEASHYEQKSYAGEVQARQQTALAFRVGGQITERYVDVGDPVKVGQVLARLDVKDAQLQLNAAQAQLESAQAAAKTAQDERQRFQQLLPMNAVSRSQYDAVANQSDSANSALKQAKSNYEVAKNQTQYNQLIANKSGVVTARNIEVGQVVAAGQAAYQIAIAGERDVLIGIPEQAVGQIHVGQVAEVTLWSKPDEKLQAYVREISPAADASRTFSVKVALREGQSTIQLGQSARVFFQTTVENTLSIPLSSVTAEQNQPYVWVVNANKTIHKVPITLGAYGRDSVPELSGLTAQDWVVIGGVHLLHQQQKIQPIDHNNRAIQLQAGAKP